MTTQEAKQRLSTFSNKALIAFASFTTAKIDEAQKRNDIKSSKILLEVIHLIKEEMKNRTS
jgi:hypothetical protein